MVSPLWVSVTQGVAIIFACWILYPILYYTNTFNAQKFGAMTTSVYTAAGKPYNASAILTPEFQLNQTALAERGAPHVSVSREKKTPLVGGKKKILVSDRVLPITVGSVVYLPLLLGLDQYLSHNRLCGMSFFLQCLKKQKENKKICW